MVSLSKSICEYTILAEWKVIILSVPKEMKYDMSMSGNETHVRTN